MSLNTGRRVFMAKACIPVGSRSGSNSSFTSPFPTAGKS